ncbi:MAG: hypothetical protein AAGK32_18775 [Actinomycetota bacterium]
METALTPAQARNALVAIRGSIGVFGLLFPRFTAKLFGIDAKANPAAVYMGRLFAVRELFMVAPFCMEDAEELQDFAIQAGVAVDAVDVVAAGAAGVSGSLPKRAALMAGLTAAAAVALGVIAQQDD